MFSGKFSISCSSFSPSGTPMIQMLECLNLSQRFLSLSSFFWILVSSFRSGWMFISSFYSKPLIWVLFSFPSLWVPCTFSFISLFIAFTFSSVLQPHSTFLWASWLPVFWTLHLTSWLSLHLLVVFFLELWTVLSFGSFFFLVLACLSRTKGWSLRYLPRQGNPLHCIVVL